MNNMNPIENMLADVRRAHRLVFEYQKRMLDLMKLVRNQYNFPNSPAGKKHFSKPLHNTEKFSKDNKDAANINIFESMWAWDFIYSYEMEYYFGEKTNNGYKCSMSIFQITDNGFYLKDGFEREQRKNITKDLKLKTEKFWDAEESSSYLIFVAEVCKEDTKSVLFPNVQEHIMELYGKENDILVNNYNECTLVAKRYPVSKFFNYDSSKECIDDFAETIKSKTKFWLPDF